MFQYVEMIFEVAASIVEGPVFGPGFVKEVKFLFHLVNCLNDQYVIR